MIFLTWLRQDDVTTSSGDVISGNELFNHMREEILGQIVKGFLKICYGSGVTQQKVGLGLIYPSPRLVC